MRPALTSLIRRAVGVFLSLLVFCAGAAASGTSFVTIAKVIEVEDGDSFTVFDPQRLTRFEVRLSDVDAPETPKKRGRPGQPYSKKARAVLVELVADKSAKLQCYEQDRYGRWVCAAWVGELNVGHEMLGRGLVWANRLDRRYIRDSNSYRLEEQARTSKRGLWAGAPAPIPPWAWRRQCWQQHQCDGAGE